MAPATTTRPNANYPFVLLTTLMSSLYDGRTACQRLGHSLRRADGVVQLTL